MSGATGSYNTDAMRGCARELDAATAGLSALRQRLGQLPPAAAPQPVQAALDRLSGRGGDMITDIATAGATLAAGLSRAAACYDELDAALVRVFGGAR